MPPVPKRRQIIEELLEHLTDYEPAPKTGEGFGDGEGDGRPAMPRIYWDPSVQELYRTLDQLAITEELVLLSGNIGRGSSVHAHLMAFYKCEFRICRPRSKKRVIRGRTIWVDPPPTTWKRERIVSPWILRPLVERGVVFVVDTFRGEPFLPKDLLAAA